jgi:hypothetical protein
VAPSSSASGLSRGEVERIWLPSAIWISVAGTSLTTSRRATRAWLGAQALSAIVIVALVTTQW